jgi:hypothetical protein
MNDWELIDPIWTLNESFSVLEAAALIVGVDPSKIRRAAFNDPNKYEAGRRAEIADRALMKAIIDGTLKATIRHKAKLRGWVQSSNHSEIPNQATPDEMAAPSRPPLWPVRVRKLYQEDLGEIGGPDCSVVFWVEPERQSTTINRKDLIEWLRSRGHTTGFFFPDVASNAPDYLNSKAPSYAPKLAAAVNAWTVVQAMTDTKGKTVKQLLMKWLRENAATYGLTDEEGNVNETGIEEVAKVANWATGGGAPKTPGK